MSALGIVGLGHMGGNMAARFLEAGYTVYGKGRHRESAEALEEEGLGWRDTPREVAEAADVGLMQKDVVLALDAARELGVPLPSAAAADEVLTLARASGYEHRDLASLFEVLARLTERP